MNQYINPGTVITVGLVCCAKLRNWIYLVKEGLRCFANTARVLLLVLNFGLQFPLGIDSLAGLNLDSAFGTTVVACHLFIHLYFGPLS